MGNSQSDTSGQPATQARPSVLNLPFYYLQQGKDWTIDNVFNEQSPIDLVSQKAQVSNIDMKIEFMLNDKPIKDIKVEDIGTSLLVNGCFSKLRATDLNQNVYEFEAVQFHFHAPAEHTINGGRYPLELHIVHQMTEESRAISQTHRDLAVIGIFFEVEKGVTPNAFIQALKLHNIGEEIELNMHELLAGELKNLMYYAYKGSLTTPPCSERVNWYVFETPLKITEGQLDYFNQRWLNNEKFAEGRGNFRELQPVADRVVLKSTNCCVYKRSEEPAPVETKAPVVDRKESCFGDTRDMSRFARSNAEGFIDIPIIRRSKSKDLDRPETHVARMKADNQNRLQNKLAPNQKPEFYSGFCEANCHIGLLKKGFCSLSLGCHPKMLGY